MNIFEREIIPNEMRIILIGIGLMSLIIGPVYGYDIITGVVFILFAIFVYRYPLQIQYSIVGYFLLTFCLYLYSASPVILDNIGNVGLSAIVVYKLFRILQRERNSEKDIETSL